MSEQADIFKRLEQNEKSIIEIRKNMEQILEAFFLRCDADDAANTQLRRNLGASPFKTLEQKMKEPAQKQVQPKNMAALPFDASKISWKPIEREDKSQWELATNNDNRSNTDYLALRKFLATEKKMVRQGMFYWLMDTAIGRQENKKGK